MIIAKSLQRDHKEHHHCLLTTLRHSPLISWSPQIYSSHIQITQLAVLSASASQHILQQRRPSDSEGDEDEQALQWRTFFQFWVFWFNLIHRTSWSFYSGTSIFDYSVWALAFVFGKGGGVGYIMALLAWLWHSSFFFLASLMALHSELALALLFIIYHHQRQAFIFFF